MCRKYPKLPCKLPLISLAVKSSDIRRGKLPKLSIAIWSKGLHVTRDQCSSPLPWLMSITASKRPCPARSHPSPSRLPVTPHRHPRETPGKTAARDKFPSKMHTASECYKWVGGVVNLTGKARSQGERRGRRIECLLGPFPFPLCIINENRMTEQK